MDHYIDLKLLSDPEFPQAQLMSALFAKIHRGLCDLGTHDVGISFPNVGRTLGDCLRMHGDAASLDRLFALNWLVGMRDHLHVGGFALVPDGAQYRCVSRVQVDSNPERARRRLMRRHGIAMDEAARRIPDGAAKHCDLPFVALRSNGSGHGFRLFLHHGTLRETPRSGRFSSYGLSSEATVPWF